MRHPGSPPIVRLLAAATTLLLVVVLGLASPAAAVLPAGIAYGSWPAAVPAAEGDEQPELAARDAGEPAALAYDDSSPVLVRGVGLAVFSGLVRDFAAASAAPDYITARPDFTPTPNRGGVPGSRHSRPYTQAGKDEVYQINAASQPDGIARCQSCGTRLTRPQQSQAGVTPPRTDGQIDHRIPMSRGGDGTPPNGDALCRVCNNGKGDTLPWEGDAWIWQTP